MAERLTGRTEKGNVIIVGNEYTTDEDRINENCDKLLKCFEKLAQYEDAEAEGKLVVLPCKVGDTVWEFDSAWRMYKHTVNYVFMTADKMIFDTDLGIEFDASALGSSLFLSRYEAEAALERMKKDV